MDLKIYREHLATSAVGLMFREAFSDALSTEASWLVNTFSISAERAMEEFLRLFVIIVFVIDTEEIKISPTSISELQIRVLRLRTDSKQWISCGINPFSTPGSTRTSNPHCV
jgi:hypothetical protein